MNTVTVSPGGERVIRALALAVIDPGELTWAEAAQAVPTDPMQGMSRVAYRLQRDRLVELLEWDGRRYNAIRLTDAGMALVRERGWPVCQGRT